MTFSSVFIANFGNISHIALVFPLLTRNKSMPAKYSVAFFAQCWKALKEKNYAYQIDLLSEPATGSVLQKKVLIKISQNSLETTCVEVSF